MRDAMLLIGSSAGLFRLEGGTTGGAFRATRIGPTRDGDGAVVGDVSAIFADPADPARIVIGTHGDGLWFTEDAGRSWAPSDGLGHTKFWCLVGRGADVFAGAEPSAIYRSRDGGRTFAPCASLATLPRHADWAFPNPHHTHHVKGIALSATHPDLLFAAVEEGWVLRSTDLGASFTNLTDGVEFDAHAVTLLPAGGSHEDVLVTSGRGLYLAEAADAQGKDFSGAFHRVTAGLERTYLSPIAVTAARPEVLVVCAARNAPPAWFRPTGKGADSALYRSVDRGRSWQIASGVVRGGAWTIAAHPTAPEVWGTGFHDGTVLLTFDDGASFREVATDLGTIGSVVFG